MGTLHNAIIDTKQQPESSPSSSQTSSSGDKGAERRVTPEQSAAVRFVPRTTHLESRKRRIQEEQGECSGTGAANEPLIGPRLPETPKLDMEDESLNTTVSLIRNTLKKVLCCFAFILIGTRWCLFCRQSSECALFCQVEAAADFKPVEKKVKPRRRI